MKSTIIKEPYLFKSLLTEYIFLVHSLSGNKNLKIINNSNVNNMDSNKMIIDTGSR
jgi:hypothetical protein